MLWVLVAFNAPSALAEVVAVAVALLNPMLHACKGPEGGGMFL